jgi:hypothetical protein
MMNNDLIDEDIKIKAESSFVDPAVKSLK